MKQCAIYDTDVLKGETIMDRQFERFRGGANEAASKRVYVSISPAHIILLNRNIYHKIGKPAAVYLNYSRELDIIAIEPASPRLPDSFPPLQLAHQRRSILPPFRHQDRHAAQIHRPRIKRQRAPPKTPRNRRRRRPEKKEEKEIGSKEDWRLKLSICHLRHFVICPAFQ